MLPTSALATMNVMFATPCNLAVVNMYCVKSLFNLAASNVSMGMSCCLHLQSDSLITRSRNRVVATFLSDNSLTHLFWVDSDIGFAPEAAYRLLLADRDVAAGVYPIKQLNWPKEGVPEGTTFKSFLARYNEFPCNPIKSDSLQPLDTDGFLEVAEAPAGFMVVKRGVFTRMMECYPNLSYTPDDDEENVSSRYHWLFFDCMLDQDSGRYLSEDFAFCRRWRQIGGKIWIDPQCNLSHVGQQIFSGSIEESLKIRVDCS